MWLAYYALDGRAIRDEYYAMGGHGEQTRAYDSFANHWWVTYATVPGIVAVSPAPKPTRGSFTAVKEGDAMVMRAPSSTDANGAEFVATISFYDISASEFEWKSENVYADKSVPNGTISCKKVAGPGL